MFLAVKSSPEIPTPRKHNIISISVHAFFLLQFCLFIMFMLLISSLSTPLKGRADVYVSTLNQRQTFSVVDLNSGGKLLLIKLLIYLLDFLETGNITRWRQ